MQRSKELVRVEILSPSGRVVKRTLPLSRDKAYPVALSLEDKVGTMRVRVFSLTKKDYYESIVALLPKRFR